ncbi:hypothetical protein L6452_41977 [Arctium lappa]|uniref:Uncharacterized protein n=1 Tax=Arctium lappa TaxID=4217 RepID=A0ACB8XI55_ARCLA|nr:hypothetical protein L6452_41977 [Arctium lappa]
MYSFLLLIMSRKATHCFENIKSKIKQIASNFFSIYCLCRYIHAYYGNLNSTLCFQVQKLRQCHGSMMIVVCL